MQMSCFEQSSRLMHMHQSLQGMQRHSGILSAWAYIPTLGCSQSFWAFEDSCILPVQGLPLYSTDNTVFLIVQSDGNLVLCVLLPSGHLFFAMYSAPMGLRVILCKYGEKERGFIGTGQVMRG